MASIQRIVSPLTKDVSYRAQVRVKGRSSESATFPNRKEAEAWAASIETAIREGRHFPHAAAKRTSFDALAKDYAETVLVEFDEVQRAARTLQLNWWSKQFAGKSVAEITADAVSKARDVCAAETFHARQAAEGQENGRDHPAQGISAQRRHRQPLHRDSLASVLLRGQRAPADRPQPGRRHPPQEGAEGPHAVPLGRRARCAAACVRQL